MRALHIPLKSGELETLATNLGEGELGYEAFAELYHLRWGIETKYTTVKQKLGLENFSGWLADSEAKREREGRENKYEYQVNVNHAIGVSKTG